MSHQSTYAANFDPHGLGIAVYRPFKPRPLSHNVGDIAFFSNDGIYHRAFDAQVVLTHPGV